MTTPNDSKKPTPAVAGDPTPLPGEQLKDYRRRVIAAQRKQARK